VICNWWPAKRGGRTGDPRGRSITKGIILAILRKLRIVLMVVVIMGMMMVGFVPVAHAGDHAIAKGGAGGAGGIAVAVGVCAVNIAIVGDAGCADTGVADASGGHGGKAIAIA